MSGEVSAQNAKYKNLHRDVWASPLNGFLDTIEYEAQEQEKTPATEEPTDWEFPVHVEPSNFHELIPAFDARIRLPLTATWMSDVARVTATPTAPDGRKIVFASLLYAEAVPPPEACN